MYKTDDEVAKITWTIEDLKMALQKNGKKPTQANIEKVLSSRCTKTLEEVSIQYGWEILDDIITNVFN